MNNVFFLDVIMLFPQQTFEGLFGHISWRRLSEFYFQSLSDNFFFYYFFYLVGPPSALDRGYPKFMLQYKSQDFVHTLRGVSALDSSPHILVTNGLGQSRSRRSPKPLSSSHTGTPGSWSPSQRSDQWRQVLDHLFLVHQALLKENCPMLL